MTRKEKMREARDNYINYLLSMGHNYVSIDNMEALFEAGVKWCDANSPTPWISVKEDLPCFHKELIIEDVGKTKRVFALTGTTPIVAWMLNRQGEWRWDWDWNWELGGIDYWIPVPELPKE